MIFDRVPLARGVTLALFALMLAGTSATAQQPATQQPAAQEPGTPSEPAAQQPTPPPVTVWGGGEEPRRPSNAVFQGARRPPRDIITLTTGVFGGYDEDLGRDASQGGPRGLADGGPFTGVDLTVGVTPSEEGVVSFNGRVSGSWRYYPQLEDLVAASNDGSMGVLVRVNERINIQGRGGFAYTPYFDFADVLNLDPAELGVPMRVRDVSFSPRRIRTFDGGTDFTYSASERTSMSVRYGVRRTDLVEQSEAAIDTTVSAGISRRINRRTASRITFVHRNSEYQVGGLMRPVRMNDLEIGLDRDWARSQTRRTTINFSVGPSLVEQQGQQLVRAFGGIGIAHPIGRTWNIRGFYRRGLTFLDGVPEPIFSNSTSLSIAGLVTRKLDLSLATSAVRGEVGVESVSTLPTAMDTYSATVTARYALSSRIALYGEYLYQSHGYNADTPSRPGEVVAGQERSGVRLGLTWYMPLVQDSPAAERPGQRRQRR